MRYLRDVVISLLCLGLLYLTFRGASGPKILEALKSAVSGGNWVILCVAVAVDLLVILVARTLKWQFLLSPAKSVPLSSLYSATVIGITTNNLLPFRIDELVRAVLLGRREGLRKSLVFGTIVVERMWDLVVLLTILGVFSFVVPLPPWLQAGGHIALLVSLVIVLALALAVAKQERFVVAIESLVGRVSQAIATRVSGMFRAFVAGVALFPTRTRLIGLLLYSLMEWTAAGLFLYLIARAFGISLTVSVGVLLIVLSYVSFAIPSSPGSVGVFEFLLSLLLGAATQIDKGVAVSFILVYHALMVVPSSLIGVFCFYKAGLSLSEIRAAEADPDSS